MGLLTVDGWATHNDHARLPGPIQLPLTIINQHNELRQGELLYPPSGQPRRINLGAPAEIKPAPSSLSIVAQRKIVFCGPLSPLDALVSRSTGCNLP